MANQEITDDVRAHSSDKRHLRPQALDSNRLIGALAAREEFQIRGQYVLSFARRPFGVDHHIEVAAADYDDSNIFHRLQNGLLSAANHNYTEFAPESISAVLTSNRDSQKWEGRLYSPNGRRLHPEPFRRILSRSRLDRKERM